MPINGTKIRDVEAFEQLAWRERHADALLDPFEGLLDAAADAGQVLEDALGRATQVLIGMAQPDLGEILRHRTDRGVDSH